MTKELRAALRKVLDEFDYWTSEPRPAIDGGTVRLHKFTEVQPEMERAIDEARAALDSAESGDEGTCVCGARDHRGECHFGWHNPETCPHRAAAQPEPEPGPGLREAPSAVEAMTDAIEGQNLYHGRYGTTPAGSATARAILSCLRQHHGLALAEQRETEASDA